MAFTPIEIIALIVIILAVVKMLVLLIKPMAWMDFASGFYKKPALAQSIAFILAVVVFYYLIQVFTVVQILAVTAFVALLMMLALAKDLDWFVSKFKARIKKGTIWKQYWFYTLIWLVLLAWGVKELFF